MAQNKNLKLKKKNSLVNKALRLEARSTLPMDR